MNGTILIVEDESSLREAIADILAGHGFDVVQAADGIEGLEAVAVRKPDLIFCDWKMPRMDGLQFLRRLRGDRATKEIPVVVMTAYGSSRNVIEASRLGAFDFLTKPASLDEILRVSEQAIGYAQLQREISELRRQPVERRPETIGRLVGSSRRMLEVFKLIGRASQTDTTVLIRGESGTGKELVAEAIHEYSARAQRPFVAVNCAALPDTLLESELFGHERGAFTGALERHAGRFELAHTGTILLDEIGDISSAMQTKLLRVLQQRSFERVGGTETIHVDVRVIATTNRDLEEAVRDGSFRSDLYYRLNVFELYLPPLRERRSDILPLAEYFLGIYGPKRGFAAMSFSEDAVLHLQQYSYPGNVRELENIVERAVSLAVGSVITSEHLRSLVPAPLRGTSGFLSLPFHEAIRLMEKQLVESALAASGGNKSEAARRLRISRRLLYAKMREHAIPDPARLLGADPEGDQRKPTPKPTDQDC